MTSLQTILCDISTSIGYDISTDILCHFCANLDLDQVFSDEGYNHHASFSDIVASGKAGCLLCEVIDFRRSDYHLKQVPEVELETSQISVTALAKNGSNKFDSLAFGPIDRKTGSMIQITELTAYTDRGQSVLLKSRLYSLDLR